MDVAVNPETSENAATLANSDRKTLVAQQNLDAAVLTAPASGVVASIANQIGEYVSGGGTSNSAFIVLTNTNALVLHGTIGEAVHGLLSATGFGGSGFFSTGFSTGFGGGSGAEAVTISFFSVILPMASSAGRWSATFSTIGFGLSFSPVLMPAVILES